MEKFDSGENNHIHILFVKRSLILYIVKLFNSLDIDRNMEAFLDFLKINSRFA